MKTTIKLLLVVVITCIVLPACKRGEEDPVISFRSRNQRLVGSWVMTSKERTFEDVQGYSNTSGEYEHVLNSTYSYDGTTAITIEDVKDIMTTFGALDTTVNDYSYHMQKTEEGSYTLDINKDGTQSYKRDINLLALVIDYVNDTLNTDIDTTYTDKNEVFEGTDEWWWEDSKKKKVLITLPNMGTYKLVRLSNKEMIWEYAHDWKWVNNNDPFATDRGRIVTERVTWTKQ